MRIFDSNTGWGFCQNKTAAIRPVLVMFAALFSVGFALAEDAVQDNAAAEATSEQAAPVALFTVKALRLDGVSGKTVTVDQIMAQSVYVKKTDMYQTLVQADRGGDAVTLRELMDDTGDGLVMDAAGIRGIAQAVFRAYADRQIVAVRVEIPQKPIANLTDPSGSGVLVIQVIEGTIEALRTIRQDQEGKPTSDDDNWYSHVAGQSPVSDGEMVRLAEIEDYIKWLNRHPGRRVDIALARGATEDSLALEYIITENRPFGAYIQLSNTGTEETGAFRQRFGLFHHSLTGSDDSLTLDYVTSGFEDVHAFTGSYSRPIPGFNRVRGRIFGSWNQYTASDIGLAGLKLDGEGYSIGSELIANVYQNDDLFIDVIGGMRYQHTESLNQAIGVPGETGFLLPSFTVQANQRTESTYTNASLGIETNLPTLGGTDQNQLGLLGRGNTDERWWLLRYGLSHSFFLEPLFQENWGEPDTGSTQAHEVFLSLQGQHTLGNDRLPASFTNSIGGLYTVRGYPQSFNAMDNAIIATAEYRIHLPRLLSPGEPVQVFGQDFRFRPERELAGTDWGLMLRTFVDAAHATHNNKFAFENNADMVGAGFGVEVSLRHNVRFRTDFAWALNEAVNGANRVTQGATQIHLELTIAY